MSGSGIGDAFNRMTLLMGEMDAGNESHLAKAELSRILQQMFQNGKLSKSAIDAFRGKYKLETAKIY